MAYQQQQNGQFTTEPMPAYNEAAAQPDYSQKPGQPQQQHPYQQQPTTSEAGYQQQQQPMQPVQHQPSMQHPMQNQYSEGPSMQNQGWQNALCNCSPCENCILGACLPCVLFGRTSERLRDPSMRSYETINMDCLLMAGVTYFTCCGWILVMMKRGEIRERFGIKGGGAGDCCTAYWCPCCALIQQEKEVKQRQESGPIAQGYQPNKEGMHMRPQ
ncbi:PLAC8 family protein [Plectosphaerella plurivora]|uniref:PLAC8 family protein n=1 Tax=Plectosphaerella plurivora TaxID=936078 RepID=A0A9P8V1A6_9PEZI|nr:PLAC8 family protein [Plectosphaerella plurivora]